MTLAFSTKWPKHMPQHMAGKPTYFVEKLCHSLKEVYKDHLPARFKPEGFDFNVSLNCQSKLHSIREDKHDRWKPGMHIHFVINNRTPQRFQFAPVIKCISVQKIEIQYRDEDGFKLSCPTVHVDGVWLTDHTQLAINDGFNSVEDFFAWFNTDFTGKIIHWTDLKY